MSAAQPRPDAAEIVTSSALYAALPLRDALREVRSTGITSIDLWSGRVICDHVAKTAGGVSEVKRILDGEGFRCASYSIYGNDLAGVAPKLEEAAALGAPLVVLGPRLLQSTPWPGDLEGLLTLVHQHGLAVALENHRGGALERLADLQSMLARFPDEALGVALAPTHLFSCGDEPAEAILALGTRLRFVYLWDVGRGSSAARARRSAATPSSRPLAAVSSTSAQCSVPSPGLATGGRQRSSGTAARPGQRTT